MPDKDKQLADQPVALAAKARALAALMGAAFRALNAPVREEAK